MLWNSLAYSTIEKAFKESQIQANQTRKAEALKRLCFYHDDQISYLEERLKNFYSKPENMTPLFINLIRKVVNNLAQVYLQAPTREVTGGGVGDEKIFAEIYSSASVTTKMKTASRYAKILKTVVLRPVWRKGKMDLDILTPDILDVEYGDVPEDLISMMITHYPSSNKHEEITYSLWTQDEVKILNYRGSTISTEQNPYLILPFVPVWDYQPTSEFWLPGGDDLVVAQEALNERLTDLLYVLRQQGFGAAYVKGLTGQTEIHLGPGSVTALPVEGDMGFAKTNAPITEIIEAIEFVLKQVAISNGLSASSLTTDPSEESGISKIISNRELEELRRDDVERFRHYEEQLFSMFRTVWNTHNPGRKLSEKCEISLDFYDPKPQTSMKEQAETWDKLMEMGVISAVDVVMQKNPDLKTRDDAIAFLLQLREEEKILNERIEINAYR